MNQNELRKGSCVGATLAGNVNPIDDPNYIGNGQVLHIIQDGRDIDNYLWYFPIPITEDGLCSLGFKFRSRDESRNRVYYQLKYDKDKTPISIVKDADGSFYHWRGERIDYIHQVQNWVHSLIKLDLTYEI